jgi:hypothetical protein
MKWTALPVIAVAMALAGCGGSDTIPDRERVRDTVQQYFEATARGDGNTACRSLTAQARKRFGALLDVPPARDCEANVRKVARRSVRLRATRVSQVVIVGDRATAQVTSARPPYNSSVALTREGDAWKLLYLPVAIHRFQLPRIHAHGHH